MLLTNEKNTLRTASASHLEVAPAPEKIIGGGHSLERFGSRDGAALVLVPAREPKQQLTTQQRVSLSVLQVTPGQERAMAARVARVAGDACADAFTLERELPRRRQGAWELQRQTVFPGYVFIEPATSADELAERLGVMTSFVRVLRDGTDSIQQLTSQDAAAVRLLAGERGRGVRRTIGMSYGDIVGGRTIVRRGPLRGRERLIRRIDRHKRLAWLDVPGIGGPRGVCVGLEVTSKS